MKKTAKQIELERIAEAKRKEQSKKLLEKHFYHADLAAKYLKQYKEVTFGNKKTLSGHGELIVFVSELITNGHLDRLNIIPGQTITRDQREALEKLIEVEFPELIVNMSTVFKKLTIKGYVNDPNKLPPCYKNRTFPERSIN